MKLYLSASQVAELAELLEGEPFRAGVVDEVLQAAEEGRGMTLRLDETAEATHAAVLRTYAGRRQ